MPQFHNLNSCERGPWHFEGVMLMRYNTASNFQPKWRATEAARF